MASGPTLREAQTWIERYQGLLAMLAFLGVGVHNQYWVLPEVRRVKNSADQQFADLDKAVEALSKRVAAVEGFRADADRASTIELALDCAAVPRRRSELECLTQLPEAVRGRFRWESSGGGKGR